MNRWSILIFWILGSGLCSPNIRAEMLPTVTQTSLTAYVSEQALVSFPSQGPSLSEDLEEPSIKDSVLDSSSQVRTSLKAVSRFSLTADPQDRGCRVLSPLKKTMGPIQRQSHPVESLSMMTWIRTFTLDTENRLGINGWDRASLDPTVVISWKIEIMGL